MSKIIRFPNSKAANDAVNYESEPVRTNYDDVEPHYQRIIVKMPEQPPVTAGAMIAGWIMAIASFTIAFSIVFSAIG